MNVNPPDGLLKGKLKEKMKNISLLIENGINIRQTNPGSALELFKQALELSVERKDERYIAESKFNMAIAYLILADYGKSLKCFSETLSCLYCDENPMLLAEVLRGFATIYLKTYNYQDALKYLYKSEQVSIEAKHYLNLHMLYGSYSSLYYKLKLNDKALEYSLKSLKVAEMTGDPYMMQYSIMSVGACYYQNGEYEQAQNFLEKSLKYKANNFSETNALYLLANIKFERKQFSEALSYTVKQIRLSRQFNFHEYEALGISRIADILFERKRIDDAAATYRKAIQITEKINDKLVNLSVYKKLIRVYEQKGDDKTLIELYKKVSAHHDDYVEKESRMLAAHNNIQEEFEKIRKEVEVERQINTRLQKALAEVKELNIKLDIVNREKNDFMAVAVHDLKNPLMNITALAKMISRNAEDKNVNGLTQNIVSQSERMFSLIRKLLDHNAIEQGNIKLNKTSFRITDFCSDIIESYRIAAKEKNIEIKFRNSLNGDILCSDHGILYQIMDNLLSNAVKFSGENKNIFLDAEKDNENIVIQIQDEGPGFTDKDKLKVFSKFSKLSAKPTNGEHSTGLGLAISKKLCDLVNADLTMESIHGKGSKFILKIKNLECE